MVGLKEDVSIGISAFLFIYVHGAYYGNQLGYGRWTFDSDNRQSEVISDYYWMR